MNNDKTLSFAFRKPVLPILVDVNEHVIVAESDRALLQKLDALGLGRGSRRRCLGERLWKRLFDDGGRPSQGPPVLDRSDQLEYRRLAPNATYFKRHGASRRLNT